MAPCPSRDDDRPSRSPERPGRPLLASTLWLVMLAGCDGPPDQGGPRAPDIPEGGVPDAGVRQSIPEEFRIPPEEVGKTPPEDPDPSDLEDQRAAEAAETALPS